MKNKVSDLIKNYWPAFMVGLFVFCAAMLFIIAGERQARIAIADNLDLFQAQYKMLKDTDTFFAHNVDAPFLHGITRNDLPSEWSLISLLYFLLPPYAAYIVNYLLKVMLAVIGFYLLSKELGYTKDHGKLAVICGFAYGLLNMFPAFGICFSSIPLIVLYLIKLCREKDRKRLFTWYLLIFAYPFLSYFSYFGLFILAYMCVAWLWLTIRNRKPSHRMFIAIVVLSLGYVLFEYRLFASMLFSKEATIRETMVIADLGSDGVLSFIRQALWDGATMHTQSVQNELVLPVCVLFLVVLNVRYIAGGKAKQIFSDIYNLIAVFILFNAVVYGIYYMEPVRNLVEAIVPQLKGWQFNRTVFFNPFLWYAAFFLAVYRTVSFVKSKELRTSLSAVVRASAYILSVCACCVIILTPSMDNDIYHTARALAYKTVKGQEVNELSYGEFYSEKVFAKAKEDIGYNGEWAAAYGFHPAVLEYSGISTIDGYLGFYSQEYKDRFRKAIAPALALQPLNAQYFDEWGARCYLYSGTEGTNVEAVRNYPHPNEPIYIDPEAMKDLDCKYIFSRPVIDNADEMGLVLKGTYTDESSPYVLNVYELK